MFLMIDDIEQQLTEMFSPFDGEMDDLILKRRIQQLGNRINNFEHELNIILPQLFIDFITDYNLDNFSLANISFGTGNDYLEKLIKINKNDTFNPWWIGNERPLGIIVIAISDPYTILLNTLDTKIYAMTSESDMAGWQPLANNFSLFIRGIGSIFLKKATHSEIIKSVAAKDTKFWESIE